METISRRSRQAEQKANAPVTAPDANAELNQQPGETAPVDLAASDLVDPVAAAEALIRALLGSAVYTHESGAVALYADQRRAGVKNGRAGHVSFASGAWRIPCSVYMDVVDVQKNGKAAVERTYRLSFPKGVKAIFADTATEKRFKKIHIKSWMDARTAKQSTADASGDDATISETDETAAA